MRQTKVPQIKNTADMPPSMLRAGLIAWGLLSAALALVVPELKTGTTAGAAGGLLGIIVSLCVVGFWFFRFRTKRATLRDVFILYIGLSVEVGFIVNSFQPGADGAIGFVAFIVPLILGLVLLLSDDTPLSARTKLLMRKRGEFRRIHFKRTNAPCSCKSQGSRRDRCTFCTGDRLSSVCGRRRGR